MRSEAWIKILRATIIVISAVVDLGYALEFRPRSAKGNPVIWLEKRRRLGYGIEVSGVRIKGDWLQMFGAPFPA